MKVLMLGWEFPPFFAGGVGIVCYELAKALAKYGDISVTYVMPYGPHGKNVQSNFKILNANTSKISSLNIIEVPTILYAYDSATEYKQRYDVLSSRETGKNMKQLYGSNILEEVELYAKRVADVCKDMDFDVIHAHDWTTIPAALLLKQITGKPIMLHVHITELDKTGGNGGHEKIFEIERRGFNEADVVIAVSNFTKNRLVYNYGVDPRKIRVIHNGGISDLNPTLNKIKDWSKEDKIILYAGRITLQKGVEYFIKAAKIVNNYDPKIKFIVAGSGDQLAKMIELATELGLSKNILFFGQYNREEANRLYSIADVFVMPSVSEPFGIVPLEAIAKGTPTIISKQSGIAEVLQNTFKVDFWDTEEMAHKMLSLLKYQILHTHMRESAFEEFGKFSWDQPTEKIVNVYRELVHHG